MPAGEGGASEGCFADHSFDYHRLLFCFFAILSIEFCQNVKTKLSEKVLMLPERVNVCPKRRLAAAKPCGPSLPAEEA